MHVKKNSRTDEAVSPVVGVLLMLVVTIIIAAVVSGFAGGLAGDTKATPSASIEVKVDTGMNDNMGGTDTKMFFEMLSGDPIPTKDLEIITYFTNSSGMSTSVPIMQRALNLMYMVPGHIPDSHS